MVRTPRGDDPGSWHHVFNRAIARRTMFERHEDFRCFLLQLACAVRRGDLEVHAYALMGTHYHLLVRSPEGRLAESKLHGIHGRLLLESAEYAARIEDLARAALAFWENA